MATKRVVPQATHEVPAVVRWAELRQELRRVTEQMDQLRRREAELGSDLSAVTRVLEAELRRDVRRTGVAAVRIPGAAHILTAHKIAGSELELELTLHENVVIR